MLTNVPVALLVEIDEAHVVAVYVCSHLAAVFDLTTHVVLSFKVVLARFVKAF